MDRNAFVKTSGAKGTMNWSEASTEPGRAQQSKLETKDDNYGKRKRTWRRESYKGSHRKKLKGLVFNRMERQEAKIAVTF